MQLFSVLCFNHTNLNITFNIFSKTIVGYVNTCFNSTYIRYRNCLIMLTQNIFKIMSIIICNIFESCIQLRN